MTRLIKDYVDVSEYHSLDDLIARLTQLRDTLTPDAEPELRLRGDDRIGRSLSISYMRPLTDEEAAVEGRYALAGQPGTLRAVA